MYSITTSAKKIAQLKSRIRAIPGGTSASKTISILLWLITLAQKDEVITLTSVVSESFPHLRRGAMRDFLQIMQEHKYFDDNRWDKTNSIYTFETGSQIEFFSVDQASKVRGARRDRLFVNEANNISLNAFEELEVRTKEFIYLDWNPVSSFWYYEEIKGKRGDIEEVTLTYKDNEALSQEIVKSIEARKNRPSWFNVYGLGQLGEVEGRMFTGWKIIDEVPHEARAERHWLDFGYTNDPTAIGTLYYHNGGYILEEVVYQRGMSNKQIADVLMNLKRIPVIADSAEPKSIDEIKSFGITILPSTKGPGSVLQGIQLVQDQQISVVKSSTNIIKEYRNMLWLVDKDGRVINEEDPMCENHHLAGIRYAFTSLIPVIRRKEMIDSLPRFAQKPKGNIAR